MTTLDAWGRNVDELGICARCGAFIKYIFYFDGKTYGSTCIEAVSGIRPDNWVFVDGKPNFEASLKAEDTRQAERQDLARRNVELEEKRHQIQEQNAVKFAELLNVLSANSWDFCLAMIETITRNGSTNDLHEILSPRQYEIVREIWGKTVGGRKNSKAYKAAIAEFDQKFDD